MKKILFTLPFLLLGIVLFFLSPFKKTGQEQGSGPVPSDWFFMQRAYPQGKMNHPLYVTSLKNINAQKKIKKDEAIWNFAGPFNTGGRLTDIESAACTSDIYAGAASGGIFKLSADGSLWESIFDEALSLSIGDIALSPSDCETIYAGTGEANCGGGSQTYDGVGVYKSTDGGNSWEHKGLEQSRNIGRIAVHPEDPEIAYVAAMGNLFADSPDRGIYKTSDGGNTWELILYVSDSTGGIDIVINPESPDMVYAALWERIRRPDRRRYGGPTCGIYKTEDGGENWTELSNGLPSPGEDVGRIGIDICQSEPDVLYAIYADKTGYFEGVYKSTNGGNTWNQTNDGALENCYQSYGWWFGRIEADPVDPAIAYVIGFDLYKTTNSGNSWSNISESDVHVDQHGLYINPLDHDQLFLGNDGGYYISADGGTNWEWINTLPITQFYTCEIDEQNPWRLYGGTQDNGTNRTLAGATDDWNRIYGGDGFYVLVDPEDNDYIYAEYQYGGLGRSTDGGLSFNGATSGISSSDRKNWNTPVVFDPANSQILYYGSNKLYKSTNRAVSWSAISGDLTNGPGVNLTYGTLTTIAVSPVNSDIIYTGTDDGNVWVTTTGGAGWMQVDETLPDRWVTRLAADPWEDNTVYVTFSGYRWDEYIPHVLRSDDNGQNWTDISGNLPEIPLNDIIVDPENNQWLYVASDAGVFSSHDLGVTWSLMGANLPLVPVNDLDLHNPTRKLVAATFGKSMYTYDLYQDTISTGLQHPDALTRQLALTISTNPLANNSFILVRSPKNVTAKIYLLDMAGRKTGRALEKRMIRGENKVGLSPFGINKLNPGIYLFVVETEVGVLSEKCLVTD